LILAFNASHKATHSSKFHYSRISRILNFEQRAEIAI
jgi:hypothetical protein